MTDYSEDTKHSYQIFSYLTSGQVQDIHPNSTTEYNTNIMSEEETTSSILSYWTPERMAAAQPIPTVIHSTEHINKEEAKDIAESDKQLQSEETVEAVGPLQIVPDDAVLKTFPRPYQSVGKL